MREKKYNVILKGKDTVGKAFIEKHGEKYNIKNRTPNFKHTNLVVVESIRDHAVTFVNVERDKNYRVKFN